ncbi:15097_t:CDS:2, partial [Cetraspora pellucida]
MDNDQENLVEKQKCDHCKGWYLKESFIGLRGRTVKSCNKCRMFIENANKIRMKNNENKKIMELQSKAYRREEIIEIFLGLLESYEDVDNTEPCQQTFNANITVHLNLFFDRVDETNKDEINIHVAYQIIKLISKADGYTYIYHTCNKLKDGFYPFLQFNEQYDNAFKDLPKNIFLVALNELQVESTADQTNLNIISQDLIIKDHVIPQDYMTFQDCTNFQDHTVFQDHQNHIVTQSIITTQECTISGNKRLIDHRKEELYSLLEHVKVIIDENTQSQNAERWINSVDKNFNAL